MPLPYVRINFANGAIGGSAAMDDGCTGLICHAAAVSSTFALDTDYLITSLKELEALGITASSTGANANVYKCVKEFYDEAPKGTKLYLRGTSPGTSSTPVGIDDLVDKTKDHAQKLLEYASGAIRTLIVKGTDPAGYSYDTDNGEVGSSQVKYGQDARIVSAVTNAQALAEAAAQDLKAPLLVLLECRHYTGTPGDLYNLTELTKNRVAVVLGDTKRDSVTVSNVTTTVSSEGAAVGLVAGRIARIPVQRSIARVKDGAIVATQLYIGTKVAESGNPATIHEKGYICPRTFVGKGGYFWSDDSIATGPSDDYCLIPRRRTVDKAARIAYLAMLEQVSDEITVTAEGKIAPAVCKNMETVMESAIINQMTSVGNLGNDPDDPNDTGVVAYVDPEQNIVATSRLGASLRVRPYGYSKYIDVDLGFQTLNH